MSKNLSGRSRCIIENVAPEIDGGKFPIKRTIGEKVVVEADIFADGHDVISAVVKFRNEKNPGWTDAPMKFFEDDRWRGEFAVTELGNYFYTVEAWINRFQSWRADLKKKLDADQNVFVELLVGADIMEEAAARAAGADADTLRDWAKELRGKKFAAARALDKALAGLMNRHAGRKLASVYEKELRVVVDRELARFGAWYELFPRSFGGFHGCVKQLPRLAKMGFDVLYLPPIHPIGKSFRKGKNNSVKCKPGEPGSPWAIGSGEGGHKAIHPELGTLKDFQHLIAKAREHKIEIALDIAFQCAPDHPYVREHPQWFRKRPDGTIQYAENPPKKYQDIVPFDFECDDWENLWRELKSVFEFWISHGIKIFRVDNPHTKTFGFWEWCIGELKAGNPELIFLSEAFTRPKPMYRLAKLGFTQSYNYFPWRNSKDELESYLISLTQTDVAEFFRPNLWPNTPDILTQFLQMDGPAAFSIRLALAATLGASYGIYGPAFELCENTPREQGSEEYLNSEKYEIKHWNLSAPHSLDALITRVNGIRRDNPALQSNRNLIFHHTDNPELIAYTKSTDDKSNTVLVVVNLNPHYKHSGWIDLPLDELELDRQKTFQMHDLLTDARYLWRGSHNYIELNPAFSSAHIFRLRRHVRTEHDFDYFM
ncbi:MAG TPA: alpha-1,4-glucan--maltose-1-phosphate maltosyltransferase [Verrucomicrobiae bacterium]|nr:alpha-1,4-glucan--maltose-1-phosphate maltosyltransferase [Verrucomicrobiae bacterium]